MCFIVVYEWIVNAVFYLIFGGKVLLQAEKNSAIQNIVNLLRN